MFQPGQVIDSQRFAEEARTLTGRVVLSELSRVGGQILSLSEPLDYALVGSREDGKLFLDLTASARVGLQCQRCLGELSYELKLAGRFLLVAEGAPWPDDELADDRYDAIPGSTNMDVIALIEDEVLLALPAAPRHDVCDVPVHENADDLQLPFGTLANFKRH